LIKAMRNPLAVFLAVIIVTGLILSSGCTTAITTTTTTTATAVPMTEVSENKTITLTAEPTITTSSAIPTTTTTKPPAITRSMNPEEEFLAKGLSNFENTNSYKFDLSLDISMNITAQKSGIIVMKTLSSGGFDKSTKEMEMKMSMAMRGESSEAEDSFSQNASYDLYMSHDWAYLRTETPELGEQWEKYSVSNLDDAFNVDIVEQQTAMLDSPSKIEIIGSEIVNGFDCFIFSVVPDKAALAKYLNEQQASGTNFNSLLDYNDVLKSYTILCYIGKDSNLLMRITYDIQMEYTNAQAGIYSSSGKTSMILFMDMNIHNLNQPFSVTLPPEAETATITGSDS
jgi:hypothetical protein